MPTTTVPPPISTHLPERFGFKAGAKGAHTSRTMMLAELRGVLRGVPLGADNVKYRRAIIEDNLLGKKTAASRKLTAQRLSELYGLDPNICLFRLLCQLWEADERGRPLLAFLCANARDPLLRITAPAVLNAQVGSPVTTQALDQELAAEIGDRLNPASRNKVARNAASSWTQSGHLVGRVGKVRAHPVVTSAVVAYAIALGFLTGNRGHRLFDTFWTRLLDVPPGSMPAMAAQAASQGWIDLRQAGDVVEIRLPNLLLPAELEAVHE